MTIASISGRKRDLVEAYDVIVLGGGPSGASAAMTLSQKGLSVAVVERSRFDDAHVGETLPGEIVRPLGRLGVWESFLSDFHSPSPGTVSIWGGAEPYENDSLFSPYGCSWHLDRARFDRMLLGAAERAGASVYRGGPLEICRGREKRPWTVRGRFDGMSLSLGANWLVDATGRSAWLGRRLGVRKRVWDRLIALIAFTSQASSTETRTVIEAARSGWWYFAPLPSGRTVTAFFTDNDLLPGRADELGKFWTNRLRETQLISRIRTGVESGSLRVVTAASSKLDRAAGDDWLAVGDAAQSYDPLSGQGVSRAISSGIAAAQAIAESRAGDKRAFGVFAANADLEFKRYQVNHRAYYAREGRWPDSAFWNRRRSV